MSVLLKGDLEQAHDLVGAWSNICATSRTQHFNTSVYKLGLPASGGRTPCETTAAIRW